MGFTRVLFPKNLVTLQNLQPRGHPRVVNIGIIGNFAPMRLG
jgi:hypothetical protein